MISFQCPHCMKTLQVQDRHAGRGTKCVKCRKPITVPTSSTISTDRDSPSGPSWLAFGLTAIVILAVGLAGGYMIGDISGRAFNARDLSQAKSQSKEAAEKMSALKASLDQATENAKTAEQNAAEQAEKAEAVSKQLQAMIAENAKIEETKAELSSKASEDSSSAKKSSKLDLINIGEPVVTPEFEITLIEVKVGKVQAKSFGGTQEGVNPHLIFVFQVKNPHERKILRYQRENTFMAGHFQLYDDVENRIRGIEFGIGTELIGALTGKEDILPGKTASHMEIFAVPPPKTKFLLLTMDHGIFDGEGKTKFKIPADKIIDYQP